MRKNTYQEEQRSIQDLVWAKDENHRGCDVYRGLPSLYKVYVIEERGMPRARNLC